ncbi:homeobox protein araucan-like [Teleopsis dalmanni]|uniref:homeobox protein araucan-like n=1 Tax=Teleopsis dalmanni TaxID=139649 RepID=UPI0018CE7B27|nr:homeobox protein araucan-like [Teleopsis dalmanni]
MAAYAQFGYGGYPPANQLLSTNAAQASLTTGGVESASNNTAPAHSPTTDCRTNVPGSGELSSDALSPDVVSPTSSAVASAGLNSAVNVAGGSIAALESAALGHHVTATGGNCCENGRPIMTDPVSGQTVCSCQYDSARLALSSYSRLPAASVGVYGAPYPSTDQNPYQSIGVDSSAFYSPLSNPYALKDSATGTEMTAWTSAGLQPTTGYYSYDPMSAYG